MEGPSTRCRALSWRPVLAPCAPGEPPADWAPVLDLASAHQVADFLYPLVREWDPPCQPAAPLMARWRTSFLGAASMYTRVAVQVRELLAVKAATLPAPDDYCYVNNFADTQSPRVLLLPPGRGAELRRDMQRLIEELERLVGCEQG